MAHEPSRARYVDEETLLKSLSVTGAPMSYAEIAAALGLEWDDTMRATLSYKVGRLVRRGKVVQVSKHDLRQRGIEPADYPPHTKFWARAGEPALPVDPALQGGPDQQLTPLGVILEARVLASGQRKTHFLGRHDIDPRTWWRLITPGQNQPRRETVIKYAERVGADVQQALKAAGFGADSIPAPALSPLGEVLEQARRALNQEKRAFLAEHGIDSRTWYRLIMPGQERPQPQTVIRFAQLAGADVAAALAAAGYDSRLAPPPVTGDRPQNDGT